MSSDLLFLLVILAFYILRAVAGQKKKQQANAPIPDATWDAEPEVPGVPRLPEAHQPANEFDEALAEIRRALGMEPPAAPQPVEDDFHAVYTGRPDSEEVFEQKPAYHEAPSRREQAFEDRAPYYEGSTIRESDFERRAPARYPSFEARTRRSEFRDPLKGHDHVDTPAPTPAAPPARRRFSLRDAVIASTIFGAPRGLSGPPKPGRLRGL